LVFLLACGLGPNSAPAADWDPNVFKAAETVDLRTIESEGDEYWFPVWVVVVDEQVFVRLGSRAAGRMKANQTGSSIGVRVNGRQFDSVHTEEAPDYAERVDAAMGEKYWSDVFVRYFSHPMTLRLVVAAEGAKQ
jgi:hypothetical protein